MVGFGEGHRPGAAPLGAVSNYFFSVFVRGLISPPYTGFVPPSGGPRRHGSAGRDTALHKSMALLRSFPILRARVKQELSAQLPVLPRPAFGRDTARRIRDPLTT